MGTEIFLQELTHQLKMTNSCEPVSTFDKRLFYLDNLSYGILSELEVSNIRPISLYKVISSGSIFIKSHERYVKFSDYISELRNNSLLAIKMYYTTM